MHDAGTSVLNTHSHDTPREQIQHPPTPPPEMGMSVKGGRVAELLLGTRVTFANLVVSAVNFSSCPQGSWALPTRTLCHYGMCTYPSEDIASFPLRCIVSGCTLVNEVGFLRMNLAWPPNSLYNVDAPQKKCNAFSTSHPPKSQNSPERRWSQ